MKNIVVLISIFFALGAYSQQLPDFEEKDTGAIIKASYIYNIAKLVDWKPDYKQGNFIISIMGGGNLHQELVKKYNNKQVGSQQIEIRKLSKTLNISRCHILFVGKEHIEMLPEIAEALKNEPTLIVSDGAGALLSGAAINFVYDEGNLKYELNVDNALKRELYVGTTLKSLAWRVF